MISYQEYKECMSALEEGVATPDQQRACHKHLLSLRKAYNDAVNTSEREARDAYFEGQANARGES